MMRIFHIFVFLPLTGLLSCSEPPGEGFPESTPSTVVVPADTTLPEVTPLDTPVVPVIPDALPPVVQALPPKEPFTSREDLVQFAHQFLGMPYIYAASDPQQGFDCSGFIYYVYQHYGIAVPRSTIEYKQYGREIPLAQAKTADLVLFTGVSDSDRIGHIGIVLAPGSDSFIHASSGKEMAVTISSYKSPHYQKRFVKAVDVISK
ncbi:MAG: peptidoglycan endopeptidase [Sphingobacteriales bacterium]|nr:MAG: peptidoglycan endopeptidase [Sphingobacteriales bacterium]